MDNVLPVDHIPETQPHKAGVSAGLGAKHASSAPCADSITRLELGKELPKQNNPKWSMCTKLSKNTRLVAGSLMVLNVSDVVTDTVLFIQLVSNYRRSSSTEDLVLMLISLMSLTCVGYLSSLVLVLLHARQYSDFRINDALSLAWICGCANCVLCVPQLWCGGSTTGHTNYATPFENPCYCFIRVLIRIVLMPVACIWSQLFWLIYFPYLTCARIIFADAKMCKYAHLRPQEAQSIITFISCMIKLVEDPLQLGINVYIAATNPEEFTVVNTVSIVFTCISIVIALFELPAGAKAVQELSQGE
jgi:hypothetical protein